MSSDATEVACRLKPTLLFLVFAAVALAQPKAQISGFVRDTTDALVQDAAIAVINLDTGVRRSTASNKEGFYAIASLSPGNYKITVRKPGFQTVARTGISIHGLDASRLDFSLEVGSMYEEVTVESLPPLTNTADAAQGMTSSRRPAELLPVNGRGLQALIDLAPGVLTTPATAGEAGQFSANGQRPGTNYFTVDGVSANNGISGSGLPGQFPGGALPAMTAIGSLHNLVSLGELDELRVQTSTFAPEYGRLPGAQVSVSTRSGSNDFHGELFLSGRHEIAAAADPFGKAAGLPELKQRLIDGGGNFAGPIRRNETFFVFSAESIRLRQPVTFLSAVPSLKSRNEASLFTRRIVHAFPLPNGPDLSGGSALHTAQAVNPSSVDAMSVRMDQALGGSGSLFVRYNRTPSSSSAGYLQRNIADFTSQTLTVGAVAALSPRLTSDSRFGFSRADVGSVWEKGAADIDLRTVLPSPGNGQRLYGIGIRGIATLLTGDDGSSHQTQWNITDTISYTTGRHDLRFGIDYQRLSPTREKAIATSTTVYESMDALVHGSIPTYTFAQTGGGTSLIETFSLFAQDTFHVTPRLNLTYGVRWEVTPAPSYRSPIDSGGETTISPNSPPLPGSLSTPIAYSTEPVWKTRATQFAPRVGAAWRLTENIVLRAGTGLFYDLGFSSAVDLVNGAPYNRWRTGFGAIAIANSLPFDTVEYGFAKDLRLPYTVHWNVAVERGLGGNSIASGAYVGASGQRLLRREGYITSNRPTPNLVLATNNGQSSYHSMQVNYRSRNMRGLQGTISYTWAHAIDNGSWDSASYLVFAGGGADQDRGSANFDVRHSFQAALGYDLSRVRLRGWTLSGTFRARTGFPIDVTTNDLPFGLGFDNDVRPDLASGVPVWLDGRLNPAAFVKPTGRQGTLGRNAIRGFGLAQLDLALQREFVVTERARLRFRVEGYNVTNSTNVADPVRIMASPLFGYSPSLANLMLGSGRPNSGLTPAFQSGGARVLQAGITLRF